jgi:CubicO group peptidase (beta-lactamase class C family)
MAQSPQQNTRKMLGRILLCVSLASSLFLDPFLPKDQRQTRQSAPSHGCPEFLTPVPIPVGELDFTAADTIVSASFSVGGVIWGIASHGQELHFGSAGYADVAASRPFTPDTISRIGSVSKVLPTIVAFQGAEEGHWALTDPFVKSQPSFRILRPDGTPGGEAAVTVRSLLSQLSGAPRECPLGNVQNYTTADAYDALSRTPLISEPFVRPSYSNLAYALVGRGLEPILGTTYEQLIQKNIFDVANMTKSGSYYTPEVVGEMATAYSPQGTGAKPGDMLTWTAPAGQAYSTARDLLRLGSMLLGSQSDLLSPTSKKEMLRPLWLNQDGISGFGTPWEVQIIQAAPGVSLAVPTKGGNVGGYSSLLVVVPDLNVTLNVLWNSGVDEGSVGRALLQKLLPQVYEYIAGVQRPVISAPSNLPPQLLGVYATPLVPGLNVTMALDSNGALTVTNSAEKIATPLSFVNSPFGALWIFRVPYNTPKVASFDCQTQMELALQGQNAIFSLGPKGWHFSIPAYLTGVVLTHL